MERAGRAIAGLNLRREPGRVGGHGHVTEGRPPRRLQDDADTRLPERCERRAVVLGRPVRRGVSVCRLRGLCVVLDVVVAVRVVGRDARQRDRCSRGVSLARAAVSAALRERDGEHGDQHDQTCTDQEGGPRDRPPPAPRRRTRTGRRRQDDRPFLVAAAPRVGQASLELTAELGHRGPPVARVLRETGAYTAAARRGGTSGRSDRARSAVDR